jgi:four helix bundle protein
LGGGILKIERFEDLECWQVARELVKLIYEYVKKPKFAKDLRLIGQITGAGISIMNNIAEGWASQSTAEFIRFLRYSRRSCAECQNCFYVALDQTYINKKEFKKGYDIALREIQIIDGLLRYLRKLKRKRSKRSKRSNG